MVHVPTWARAGHALTQSSVVRGASKGFIKTFGFKRASAGHSAEELSLKFNKFMSLSDEKISAILYELRA